MACKCRGDLARSSAARQHSRRHCCKRRMYFPVDCVPHFRGTGNQQPWQGHRPPRPIHTQETVDRAIGHRCRRWDRNSCERTDGAFETQMCHSVLGWCLAACTAYSSVRPRHCGVPDACHRCMTRSTSTDSRPKAAPPVRQCTDHERRRVAKTRLPQQSRSQKCL